MLDRKMSCGGGSTSFKDEECSPSPLLALDFALPPNVPAAVYRAAASSIERRVPPPQSIITRFKLKQRIDSTSELIIELLRQNFHPLKKSYHRKQKPERTRTHTHTQTQTQSVHAYTYTHRYRYIRNFEQKIQKCSF
jgi:hypothetical protein